MGHSSPEMTSAIYDHSVAEDFRSEMDRAPTFGIGLPPRAGAMQPPSGPPKEKAPGVADFAGDSEALDGRGDRI
jgi:hypothetical protein